ncbi:MAG: ABC transporter ATP-binding protein [Bdellovibrionales bacterium]
MSAVVQINNLTKKFGDFTAVQNLTLEMKKGESFGLIGPRGSGKSTVFKLLYGALTLTTGEAFLLGLNVRDHILEIKSRVGIVPQEGGFDPELTVFENLKVLSQFYKFPDSFSKNSVEFNLRRLKLEDKIDNFVSELSYEQTKRLSLARALIHKPELLLVDDFFLGLTESGIKEFIEFFNLLKSEGVSVLHTFESHTYAEILCDRVGLMDHGRILISGTPGSLKSELIGQHILEFESHFSDMNYYLQKIRESDFEYQVYRDTVNVFVRSPRTLKDVYSLISSERITMRKANLADVFLRLSGRPLGSEK